MTPPPLDDRNPPISQTTSHHSPRAPSQRMLDFRSGGWILLLSLVIVVAIVVGRLIVLWPHMNEHAVGDGKTLESYGFDLSTLRVPRELLVPAGPDLPKDGLPALIRPPFIKASDLKPKEWLGGVRELHSSDRVIGVVFNGEARAYPLWVMCWHEIMNDVVGDQPIAITYSPLCDSVVVFDRRLDGEELTFGVSGLLYNSNQVMYDRRAAGPGMAESLWSQLLGRAIAGPAAAKDRAMTILPVALCSWSQWLAAHPETTIVTPDAARKRLYRRDAYLHYFGIDKLYFPVSPLPTDGRPLKTPIVARRVDNKWEVRESTWQAGEEAVPAEQVFAFWFAWHATHVDE